MAPKAVPEASANNAAALAAAAAAGGPAEPAPAAGPANIWELEIAEMKAAFIELTAQHHTLAKGRVGAEYRAAIQAIISMARTLTGALAATGLRDAESLEALSDARILVQTLDVEDETAHAASLAPLDKLIAKLIQRINIFKTLQQRGKDQPTLVESVLDNYARRNLANFSKLLDKIPQADSLVEYVRDFLIIEFDNLDKALKEQEKVNNVANFVVGAGGAIQNNRQANARVVANRQPARNNGFFRRDLGCGGGYPQNEPYRPQAPRRNAPGPAPPLPPR